MDEYCDKISEALQDAAQNQRRQREFKISDKTKS